MSGDRNPRNPFQMGIRGNIKSNAQIDSFHKSQEVFQLLQKTIGSPGPPKELRIPRRYPPPRDASDGRNLGNRGSFNRQGTRKGNSRGNDRRNYQRPSLREPFSRRGKKNHSYQDHIPSMRPGPSSNKQSGKRSHDDSSLWSGFESSEPKYSAYSEVIDERNTAWRGYEQPPSMQQFSSDSNVDHAELHYPNLISRNSFQYKCYSDYRDIPLGNDPYSGTHVQEVEKPLSTEWSRYSSDIDVRCLADDFYGRYFFDDHTEQVHHEPNVLCDKDGRYFFDDHTKEVHHEPNVSCDKDGRYFFEDHTEQVHHEPNVSCDKDGRYFFDDHTKEVHHEPNVSCDKDGRYFSDDHAKEVHHESNEFYESNPVQSDWSADINSAASQQQESDYKSEHDEVPKQTDVDMRRKKANRKMMKTLTRKAEKLNLSKPCSFEIKDNSDPLGRVAEHNVPALLKSISNIVEETALMNPLNKNTTYPRYLGHYFKGDRLVIMCADFASRDFLLRRLETIAPPWSGALLKCWDRPHRECFVDVKLPTSIRHLSEFRSICEEKNKSVNTKSWRLIGYKDIEGSDQRLYTIGMDTATYDVIHKKLMGRIRFGDDYINIVLNDNKSQESD